MEFLSRYSSTRDALLSGKVTCASIVEHYLNAIETSSSLNAFLEVFSSSARERALKLDQEISSGKSRRLTGMVIAIKDNIAYKGHKVGASSKILEGFTSIYNATVIERLLAEGAIIIGRTNCDEFAMGSSNENSAFGLVRNPIDITRVPGGSSGGSAAAVAAGLCMAALGSDTGGSIRQPASFCGVVGIKPTYGRVSRYGLLAYASSFDQIGPLTRNIEEAALIMEVISGSDDYDSTVSNKPVKKYSALGDGAGKKKIAYLKECVDNPGLDPGIRDAIFGLIEKLKSEGHAVEPVEFPFLDYLVPTYYVLTTAEASSNLARYDGVHFGYRSPNATDLESTYKKSRSEGFGKEVQRRIMLGTFVLSAGYYDAYYARGQKVRRILRNKVNEIFSSYDLILSPTTPGTAFKHGEINDPIKMYLEDIFTVLANLSGIPAVSVPLFKSREGLPFGAQVMANHFEEEMLFTFSHYLLNNKA